MTTKIPAAEAAKSIAEFAKSNGVKVMVCANGIVSAYKTFTPGDKSEYCAAEMDVESVICRVPRARPGSVWGTDSGSIGGVMGCKAGRMELHKSGCNKNVLRELAKLC